MVATKTTRSSKRTKKLPTESPLGMNIQRPANRSHEVTSTLQTLSLASASAFLMWLAFPPVGWWPLAWVAPIGWLRLIRQPQPFSSRSYWALYAIGFVHWMLMTQWVRLPHWSAGFGWIALSLYLAIYVPLFIGATRIMVHLWRVPSVVAAPVVWVGLELARGRLFTGFSLCLLAHSQVDQIWLLQLADSFGAYGVSFVVMLVAAAIERGWPLQRGEKMALWPAVAGLGVVAAALVYGYVRLAGADAQPSRPQAKVALIQGSVDTLFDVPIERFEDTFHQYRELSRRAVTENQDIDLVVWPESMFTATSPVTTYEPDLTTPTNWPPDLPDYQSYVAAESNWSQQKARNIASELGTSMLVGTGWRHVTDDETIRYNSAVLYDSDGATSAVYHKMHPVMFGEYVPLADFFPWLYRLTPFGTGLTAGTKPVSLPVAGLRLSPCICFENTVPHLVRRHVLELTKAGESPDALVTLTNDGWFWGSSLLDLHLACGVFRAVEHRRPMLIAANTGFSAWIDGNGRKLKQGPRRAQGVLIANLSRDPRGSLYTQLGDAPSWLCLCAVVVAFVHRISRRARPN